MRLRRSQPGQDSQALAALGRRIGEARLAAGLTRNELAEQLNVDALQFAHFEAGEEDPTTYIPRIAHITGTSAAWLRGEEPAAPPAPAAAAPDPAPEPEPEQESEPEPAPAPEPEHTEEESMDHDLEPEDSTTPHEAADEPAAPAMLGQQAAPAAADDDFSEDDLTRVLTGLSRQKEAIAARRAELDEREQMLSDREDHIGAREDAVTAREAELGDHESSRSAMLDDEWQEKLQSFEETNRQYAAAATALADWAAELRGEGGEASAEEPDPEPEPVAAAAVADDFEEPPAPPAQSEGEPFPEDF